jgi:SAM-dependent methyltransferase
VHSSVLDYVARAVAQHGPFASVCEVGCRDINGGVRTLFDPNCVYVGVDLLDGTGVDVVTNFATWETDQRFDCIVSTSTLEHTPDGEAIIANAARLLNPHGVLIVTCAGTGWGRHSAIDEGPIRADEFYENVDVATLDGWVAAAGFSTWIGERNEQFSDTCCTAVL